MTAAPETVGSMVAAAREIATDATIVLSVELLDAARTAKLPSGDPVDRLVARVRERAPGAVDALQAAALLESDGLNDRAARVEYGFADVFDLADEVYRRLGGTAPAHRPAPRRPRSAREIMHGLVYLLPAALFPAVTAVVPQQPLIAALVTAGALGWVWSGGAGWLAYQGLNLDDPRAAGRVLAWACVTGVTLAAAVGLLVAVLTGGGWRIAILVPGVLAYQMASTVFVFYRHELLLAVLVLPAATLGVVYLTDHGVLRWALGAVCAGVVVALGLALRTALRAGAGRSSSTVAGVPTLLRGRVGVFLSVVGYAALSAAFLLHAQARYLSGHLDVVLAGAPLIVAMGVVEWRARVYAEQGRHLLHAVRYPAQFVRRIWLLLVTNLAVCVLAVGAVAGALLWILHRVGWLTPAGTAMALAQVALGGAYFLAFVLANHQRYVSLCVALAVCIATHLAVSRLVSADAFTDITVFLGSAVLLQVLLVVALTPVLSEVRRYR
jgi:hypothetical protein